MNKTNESEIKEQIAENAEQHVTTHDIILLFGESDLYLHFLKEIKTIDCSVLYVESSISGMSNYKSNSLWFISSTPNQIKIILL